ATSAENIGGRGIYVAYTAATAGTGSALIEGNDVRAGDYSTTGYSANIAGIEVAAANPGLIIRRNNIHDVYQQTANGWGAWGIALTSGTTNNDIRIENNFIRDMVASQYSAGLTSIYESYGIYISGAVTDLRINFNT